MSDIRFHIIYVFYIKLQLCVSSNIFQLQSFAINDEEDHVQLKLSHVTYMHIKTFKIIFLTGN